MAKLVRPAVATGGDPPSAPGQHRHSHRLAHVAIGPPAAAGDRGSVHQLAAAPDLVYLRGETGTAARMDALGPRSQGQRPRATGGRPGWSGKIGACDALQSP
jgi:hypothetical protein